MLDLLGGEPTERTELAMVRSKPVPFPPEPVRSAVIQLTRASLARADRNEGRRDLWLRTLDRLGWALTPDSARHVCRRPRVWRRPRFSYWRVMFSVFTTIRPAS